MPAPRRGARAASRHIRPLGVAKPYPGTVEKWERDHLRRIIKDCKALGLDLIFHDPDSRDIRRAGKSDEDGEALGTGFPDLWIVGHRRLLVRELKRDSDGRVSDRQAKWLDALTAVGIDAGTWWLPEDYQSGKVSNTLNEIRRRGPVVPDLTNEVGKLMFLAVTPAAQIPAAAVHWDAGSKTVNRSLWRYEANQLLHRAASALPIGDAELTAWLRTHQLPADAKPAAVLAAVRQTLTRHEELPE